jgi:UDP-N-acetylglucosamine--N-acetylmuramyl-(pentapeptide) pyrophosphoryl-undecaprenol N-acetylglucosamine transferase
VRVLFSGGGTGGHLYPGLAIARALVRRRPDVRPHFVGGTRGVEHDVLAKCEFPYTLLNVHPLYKRRPWNNWKTLAGGVGGWRTVSALARQERPELVVGLGGYASAVALGWAWARGVPIVQQIGDAFPGKAARWFARASRECYLGFADARAHLPEGRTRYIVTGNPIDPPPVPRPDRAALMRAWKLDPASNVLLVFGGSQGSLAINQIVAEWTRTSLLDGWSVIWATGTQTYDQFRSAESDRVRVVPYLSPIADAYAVATLALVRGGAMGTAELCAWGVPMIIVPLPTAAMDHQTWNAKSLEKDGAAIHVPQSQLTAQRLRETISSLGQSPSRLKALSEASARRGKPTAAADIARHIAQLLPA